MRLKSLELVGFKSFTEKTDINFSKGVTAIVGPNGSGKSNIVDAIRWVMGETAPTFIRTKLLEDVIFSGSEAAPQMGMAEVTLIFDNREGQSPIGYESFSEIQVTRRAFRDGGSEFFINKVPCRLKDIVELFFDAGSGARGYCIIEQSKVQHIISAKSLERRMLIEEAAGVAKYRLRKKEAARKIENTVQNLARVSDILLEVKRQLGSIDRQARKAERFKKLKKELLELEVELLRRRMGREHDREAELGGTLERLKSSLDLKGKNMEGLKTREQTIRNKIFSAEANLDSLRESHSGTNEAFYRLDTEIESVKRELERSLARGEEVDGEIVQLKAELDEMNQRLISARKESEEMEEKLSGFEGHGSLAYESDGDRKRDLEELKTRYEEKRDHLVTLLSEISGIENADRIQKKWHEETERKVEHLMREGERIRAELSEAESRISKERERESHQAREMDKSEEDISRLKSQVSGSEKEIQRLESRLLGFLKDREATHSRLSAMKNILAEYEVFGESVSFTMKEVKKEREDLEIVGVLGNLIEVEKGYERVVEAALGEGLRYIVVKDASDGVAAIKSLKSSGKGKASFAPVKIRKRGGKGLEIPSGEGVISSVSGIISTPVECRELVEDILGDVVLVNKLEDAIRLWKINGCWATYVTLDGDVIHPSGVITGGSLKDERAGVLVQKREMADLENRYMEIEKNISITEEKLEALRLSLEDGMRSLKEHQETLTSCEKGKHSISVNLEYLEREREKGRKMERWSGEELSHLQAEIERFHEQRTLKGNQLVQLRSEVTALEEELKESRERIESLEAEQKEYENEASRRNVKIVEFQEKRKALDLELTSIDHMMKDKRSYLVKAEEERIILNDARKNLEEQLHSMEVTLKGIAGKRDHLEEKLMGEVKNIEGLKLELEGTMGDIGSSMADIDEAKEELAQLREEMAALKAGIQNSRSMLRDSYALEDIDAIPIHEALKSLPEEEIDEGARERRRKIESIGEVNIEAIEEREELAKRYEELSRQKSDLVASMEDLKKVITKIDRESKDKFREMFDRVNERFSELFPRLFMGGKGNLVLSDEDDILESGVEIVPQPPGKKLKNLSLLSNGEKALAGICLLLSLFFERPGPFLFLDEVDAPLDEANVDRFNRMIRDISSSCQIILITHKKRSMELADYLYGITMDRPGISRVVSAQLS